MSNVLGLTVIYADHLDLDILPLLLCKRGTVFPLLACVLSVSLTSEQRTLAVLCTFLLDHVRLVEIS